MCKHIDIKKMNNSMYSSTIMNSSVMSDNYSVQSYVSSGGGGGSGMVEGQPAPPPVGGIMVEEVGNLIFGDIVPKKMVMLNYTLAVLSDDGRLLLGEIRSRGGDDWALAGRSLVTLNDNDRKYLDVTLVPNIQQERGSSSVIFLAERIKNKERCITAHNIKHGKILELKEEFSSYDKVNVLGKAVSHISSYDEPNEPPTVYAVSSNLVRKLRLEDAGTNLKPTTARAQVPPDCQDGTLAICVQSSTIRRPSTAPSSNQNSNGLGSCGNSTPSNNQVNVIVAFRTKSAGKNKYTIEYYNSKNKGDEIFNSKCSIKLNEENEPTVLLTDPKDNRSVYALCVNKNNGTTALYKISKGKRNDEPIRTFNYEIRSAAMSFSAEKNIILVTYDGIGDIGRIYVLQKTEGFRGRHPMCAHCPSLEALSSSSHITSCTTNKWQLTHNQVEHVIGLNRPIIQVALATLIENGSCGNKFICEPEQEIPYRLRIVGCESQGLHPEMILLEDLERTFDGGEEHRLSNSVLKVCLGHSPCKECYSQLSSWLMNGRISAIELHYVTPPAHENNMFDGGSERFLLKPMNVEKFRSLVSDIDWTQTVHLTAGMSSSTSSNGGRQGTFTLEDQEAKQQRPQSALTRGTSPRSSGGAGGGHIAAAGGSRIPTPRASVERSLSGRLSSASSSSSFPTSTTTCNSQNQTTTMHHQGSTVGIDSGPGSNGHSSLNNQENHHASAEGEKIIKLKAIVRKLSTTLNSVLDADATMRNNLHSLREDVEEIMTQTDEIHMVEQG